MSPPNQDVRALVRPGVFRPAPAARPEQATRAMQRFACTGAACPDTCCRDFGVAIDRDDMAGLLAATARDPIDRARIVRLVVLPMASPGPAATQTSVALGEDGACPMLEGSGHCGIHRKYGEAVLGTTCSVFPRTSLAVDDRLEITGTLACPELARLTLLTEDGLSRDVVGGASLLPRRYVGKTVATGDEGADAYAAPFTRVRDTLLRLFGRADFPLGSRLLFAAQLAAQLDDFFHAGTDAFTGARRSFTRQRLEAELTDAVEEASLRGLHGDLQAFGGGTDAVVAGAAALLIERLRLPHAPRFAALVKGAFESLQRRAIGGAAVEQSPTPAALSAALGARHVRLERRLPGLADRILARYCLHFLLRHPYTDAPSLLGYLGRMALSVAAIRLLLLGSPGVGALLDDADASVDPDEERFSAIAVDVVQIYTKAISHQVDFMAAVHRANEGGAGVGFGRLVLYAKFI